MSYSAVKYKWKKKKKEKSLTTNNLKTKQRKTVTYNSSIQIELVLRFWWLFLSSSFFFSFILHFYINSQFGVLIFHVTLLSCAYHRVPKTPLIWARGWHPGRWESFYALFHGVLTTSFSGCVPLPILSLTAWTFQLFWNLWTLETSLLNFVGSWLSPWWAAGGTFYVVWLHSSWGEERFVVWVPSSPSTSHLPWLSLCRTQCLSFSRLCLAPQYHCFPPEVLILSPSMSSSLHRLLGHHSLGNMWSEATSFNVCERGYGRGGCGEGRGVCIWKKSHQCNGSWVPEGAKGGREKKQLENSSWKRWVLC